MHPHAIIGIIQAAIYGAVFIPASYVFLQNWRYELRWASWPLVSFSFFQFIVGIMSYFCQEYPDNKRLIDATIILVNMGVGPLMSVIVGFLNKVLITKLKKGHCCLRLAPVINVLFWAITILSWIGLFLMADFWNLSLRMTQAGYSAYAVLLVLMAVELGLLSSERHGFDEMKQTFIELSLLSIIPLGVRIAYGLLCVFNAGEKTIWNPVTGSVPAGICMCLLTETVVYSLYFFLACCYYDEMSSDGECLIRESPRPTRNNSRNSSRKGTPKGSEA
ncbi:hypothetical protein FGRMN_451 [Fusarium graminum]|nr:hypothetical protein FGRMN_451 [Fusarium graminum]